MFNNQKALELLDKLINKLEANVESPLDSAVFSRKAFFDGTSSSILTLLLFLR